LDTFRVVDQIRKSRGKRQQAERALLSVQESEEPDRSRLIVQAMLLQNEAIAALEQALLGTVEVSPAQTR
jgi:hypothetical protein